ncbi:MAG: LLM class flavin-dependent oxidoreductase [Solirubrobacteraceae bacterium]
MPVLIAALSPAMLRLAGEIADGVVLWLCTPAYIRDVVVPEVTVGRDRAGRTLEGFRVIAAVPAGVTGDRAAAYDSMRTDLLPYFGLPFYRSMLERSGFSEEIAAYDAAGGEFAAMRAAISAPFLDALTAIGDEPSVREGIERYRSAGADLPCVGPVPRTEFEVTLRAAAP